LIGEDNYKVGKTRNQKTGFTGELLARQFFEQKGFEILQTNWRCGHLEIDIIASRNMVLHIIEVKTQSGSTAGFPEENVNRKKMHNLMKAAEKYMLIENKWTRVQFDILSVILHREQNDLFLLEDVYF
jgi:putative endonuclease